VLESSQQASQHWERPRRTKNSNCLIIQIFTGEYGKGE
jgi:hypothetical protein